MRLHLLGQGPLQAGQPLRVSRQAPAEGPRVHLSGWAVQHGCQLELSHPQACVRAVAWRARASRQG